MAFDNLPVDPLQRCKVKGSDTSEAVVRIMYYVHACCFVDLTDSATNPFMPADRALLSHELSETSAPYLAPLGPRDDLST